MYKTILISKKDNLSTTRTDELTYIYSEANSNDEIKYKNSEKRLINMKQWKLMKEP